MLNPRRSITWRIMKLPLRSWTQSSEEPGRIGHREIQNEINFYSLALSLARVAFAPSCSKTTNPAERTLYTCGMHPQVVQDHPAIVRFAG